MNLNENQEKAVRAVKGRILVLAGAGSGKTGVIVHRIAHLIRDHQVSPQSILGLTFTNKAAAEMRHRVESMIGPAGAKQVTLSTFHSFCMHVLRKEIERIGYTREFSLYDEKDLQRLITQLTRDMLNHDGELPSLAPTRAALTEAANLGLYGKEEGKGHTWHDSFSKELYHRLHSTLRAYNAVSFDSLITLTIRLFEEHPAVLDRYQERYRFLMIDEYQDTNPAQFQLAELLAAKFQNLCVVGDDDQSIYGWRGAEVEHILHFRADAVIKLEQNYRSTPSILDAANAVIRNNRNRHEKKLWTSEKQGHPIEIFNAPTDVEEASSVVARMIRLHEKEGLRWRDMAILYRSNALSRQFEMALMQASWQKEGKWMRGIPYEVFGGLEFNERSEIKDLLAYLRAIANPLDEEALLRIINVPRRGISDEFLDALTQQNRSEKVPLWNLLQEVRANEKMFPKHPKAMKGVQKFVDLLQNGADRFAGRELQKIESGKGSADLHPNGVLQFPPKRPLADSLVWLLEEIDYKKAIQEEVKSEKMREFKWENVQECVNALAQYEQELREAGRWEEITLQHFISNTTLARQAIHPASKQSSQDLVHLMTFHSAKGLEFPACFLVGLEDGILPHEKSMAQTGLEEERRLFYVGITRAKRFLTLSMARTRLRMGKAHPTNPSRFLFEIPKHLLKVADCKIFE